MEITNKSLGGNEEKSIPDPIIGDDGEKLYIVEKIKGHRGKGKKKEYFIKWKGYPDKDNTWEPLKNLQMIKVIISNYEDNLKNEILKQKAIDKASKQAIKFKCPKKQKQEITQIEQTERSIQSSPSELAASFNIVAFKQNTQNVNVVCQQNYEREEMNKSSQLLRKGDEMDNNLFADNKNPPLEEGLLPNLNQKRRILEADQDIPFLRKMINRRENQNQPLGNKENKEEELKEENLLKQSNSTPKRFIPLCQEDSSKDNKQDEASNERNLPQQSPASKILQDNQTNGLQVKQQENINKSTISTIQQQNSDFSASIHQSLLLVQSENKDSQFQKIQTSPQIKGKTNQIVSSLINEEEAIFDPKTNSGSYREMDSLSSAALANINQSNEPSLSKIKKQKKATPKQQLISSPTKSKKQRKIKEKLIAKKEKESFTLSLALDTISSHNEANQSLISPKSLSPNKQNEQSSLQQVTEIDSTKETNQQMPFFDSDLQEPKDLSQSTNSIFPLQVGREKNLSQTTKRSSSQINEQILLNHEDLSLTTNASVSLHPSHSNQEQNEPINEEILQDEEDDDFHLKKINFKKENVSLKDPSRKDLKERNESKSNKDDKRHDKKEHKSHHSEKEHRSHHSEKEHRSHHSEKEHRSHHSEKEYRSHHSEKEHRSHHSEKEHKSHHSEKEHKRHKEHKHKENRKRSKSREHNHKHSDKERRRESGSTKEDNTKKKNQENYLNEKERLSQNLIIDLEMLEQEEEKGEKKLTSVSEQIIQENKRIDLSSSSTMNPEYNRLQIMIQEKDEQKRGGEYNGGVYSIEAEEFLQELRIDLEKFLIESKSSNLEEKFESDEEDDDEGKDKDYIFNGSDQIKIKEMNESQIKQQKQLQKEKIIKEYSEKTRQDYTHGIIDISSICKNYQMIDYSLCQQKSELINKNEKFSDGMNNWRVIAELKSMKQIPVKRQPNKFEQQQSQQLKQQPISVFSSEIQASNGLLNQKINIEGGSTLKNINYITYSFQSSNYEELQNSEEIKRFDDKRGKQDDKNYTYHHPNDIQSTQKIENNKNSRKSEDNYTNDKRNIQQENSSKFSRQSNQQESSSRYSERGNDSRRDFSSSRSPPCSPYLSNSRRIKHENSQIQSHHEEEYSNKPSKHSYYSRDDSPRRYKGEYDKKHADIFPPTEMRNNKKDSLYESDKIKDKKQGSDNTQKEKYRDDYYDEQRGGKKGESKSYYEENDKMRRSYEEKKREQQISSKSNHQQYYSKSRSRSKDYKMRNERSYQDDSTSLREKERDDNDLKLARDSKHSNSYLNQDNQYHDHSKFGMKREKNHENEISSSSHYPLINDQSRYESSRNISNEGNSQPKFNKFSDIKEQTNHENKIKEFDNGSYNTNGNQKLSIQYENKKNQQDTNKNQKSMLKEKQSLSQIISTNQTHSRQIKEAYDALITQSEEFSQMGNTIQDCPQQILSHISTSKMVFLKISWQPRKPDNLQMQPTFIGWYKVQEKYPLLYSEYISKCLINEQL